jgi:hypothetical protein
MIGQSIKNGQMFRDIGADHALVGLLLGNMEEVSNGQGKMLNFERMKRTQGLGPKVHADIYPKTATQLVLGSSGANGEGAAVTRAFSTASFAFDTGWYAFQVRSTIYESDLIIQNGKELLTEDIAETEAERVQEAIKVMIATQVYGTTMPDKNSFGSINGLVSDGMTQAQREAAYTDASRNGALTEAARKDYGLDSAATPRWQSDVIPFSTTPTVQAVTNFTEFHNVSKKCKVNSILSNIVRHQVWRDALDSTNGAITTALNQKRQDLGITGFSYRNIDFIMDNDAALAAGGGVNGQDAFYGIDPSKYTFHFNDQIAGTGYTSLKGIVNAAMEAEFKVYMQLTLGSRRSQIKWVKV